jgi:hypothetical protein
VLYSLSHPAPGWLIKCISQHRHRIGTGKERP